MPAFETTEDAAESCSQLNAAPRHSQPAETLETRIEQLKTFVRRRPQTSAGVIAYWLTCENR
jgi:hypothetical protein